MVGALLGERVRMMSTTQKMHVTVEMSDGDRFVFIHPSRLQRIVCVQKWLKVAPAERIFEVNFRNVTDSRFQLRAVRYDAWLGVKH